MLRYVGADFALSTSPIPPDPVHARILQSRARGGEWGARLEFDPAGDGFELFDPLFHIRQLDPGGAHAQLRAVL